METQSLSYKTIKNVGYSFFGYAFPILFSVFITPVVVHRLGIANYGIYILVNTVLAFAGLLDLGLAVSLVKYISEYHATNESEKIKQLVYSANSMYAIIGVGGFIIFFILGKFFLQTFNITYTEGVFPVFLLAGVVFFLNAANSVFVTIPLALQRYDISTKLNLFQLAFFNIGTLVLVSRGYGLKAIFTLQIISILLATVIYIYYSRKLIPFLSYRLAWFSAEIKKAYRFGVLAAITNLSSNALFQLDRFIIPIFLTGKCCPKISRDYRQFGHSFFSAHQRPYRYRPV